MKTLLIKYLSPQGRSISKRFSEKAFHNSGNSSLLEYVNSVSSNLHESVPFSVRCWAVISDNCIQQYCRTCNSPILSKTENGWDKYCNKKCANTDPTLSSQIICRRKKVDEKSASEKRRNTMLEKFGVEYAGQRDSHKESLSEKAREKRDVMNPLLESYEYLYNAHVIDNIPVTKIADNIGVWYDTVIQSLIRHNIPYKANCSGYNRSGQEDEISSFIESLGVDVIRGDRNKIGMEIDIFIPEKNIAIEFNGTYWHSIGVGGKQLHPNYHYNKTNLCNEKGIRLIHVNEFEWQNNRPIIESMIKNAVGKTENRIFARKLEVSDISPSDKKKFFEDNHIHGDSQSKINLCLKKEGVIYAVVSFARPRFSKEADWEIVRFSSLLNHNIVGGFGKLLSSFRGANTGSVMSYSDRMKGTGGVYESSGFEFVRTTNPGYSWCDRKNSYPRSRFMKKSLGNVLGDRFDPSLSERENMFKCGYRIFFDSGNDVWVLK